MSRFRLYGSGGRPVYDSAGEPEDRRLERIKQEFNAGVAAFYDPGAGLVRAQVKIHRRSPEQFVATYQSDAGDDLLATLFDRVEALSERRGWTIQRGIGGTQALYDALADGSALGSDATAAVEADLADGSISPDRVREAVEALGAVDLAVPDYDVAAATLAYVRESFPDYAVAVSESTDAETIAGADVVIRPTGSVDRVVPGAEFSAWLERRRVATATAALNDAVESAAAGFESASVSVSAGVAAAVDRTTPASELGVHAVPPSAPPVTRRELRQTLSYGLPTGVVVGAAAGGVWSVVGSVPRWLLGAGCLLAVVVWVAALLAIRLADDPDRLPDAPGVDSEVEPIGAALSQVAAAGGADAAREALASVLDPYGVTLEPDGDRDRRRRRAAGGGVAASAVVCAVAFAVIALLL
jgi:hypothetical protein